MYDVEYINGGLELIDEIKPLWEKLNIHHLDKSIDFKEKYKRFTFEKRKEGIIEKSKTAEFHIELAQDMQRGICIGYCLSSVQDNGTGEVESLFLDSDYRGQDIGQSLMEKTLDWLHHNNAKPIIIGVASGNENAFGFYSKFGFYPKVTILEQKID